MKKTVLFILLFTAYFCNAQNYQCLQSGVKHYFMNGNGYLRGIRIDSVKMSGSTTVYFPFHTPRGSYDNTTYSVTMLDPNGGSWLGKKVQQRSNGIFIFDSYWNDSVIIKTQASIGDSWIFYSDTSHLFYKATVLGIDTMTVLGGVDSVKQILVTAQNLSGTVISDPLDSFQILLSKNNGFVQVFDLYTFPYHKPNSVYTIGLDFFLDRSTLGTSEINTYQGYPPTPSITMFKLINLIIPNDQQLNDWNVGDSFESSHSYGTYFPYLTNEKTLYTVINKVISGHEIIDSLNILKYPFTGSVVGTTGIYSDLNYSIIDTTFMPEQYANYGNYFFYFSNDSSFCFVGSAYIKIPCRYYIGGLGEVYESTTYKLGIGETHYNYFDGNPTTIIDDLLYYSSHGINCGFTYPNKVNNLQFTSANQMALFPNPATTSLTITSSYKITSIAITNLIGQTVYSNNYHNEEVQIDVSALPTGMYLIRINGTEIRKFVKE